MRYKTDVLARHQIDRLLRIQATICTNLGIDSSKQERKEADKKIAILR
jgi:hypothetical protein